MKWAWQGERENGRDGMELAGKGREGQDTVGRVRDRKNRDETGREG